MFFFCIFFAKLCLKVSFKTECVLKVRLEQENESHIISSVHQDKEELLSENRLFFMEMLIHIFASWTQCLAD